MQVFTTHSQMLGRAIPKEALQNAAYVLPTNLLKRMAEHPRSNHNGSYSRLKTREDNNFLRVYYQLRGTHYDPLPHSEQIILAQKALEGDIQARNRLLETYQRFVIDTAKSYQGQELSFSELLSAGNLGLIASLKYFKPELGYKITTYVVRGIRQSIEKELRAHRNGKTISLDRVVEDQEPLLDLIPSQNQSPSDIFERSEDYKLLTATMSTLDMRERKVISLHFYEGVSLKNIAEGMEISQGFVSQIKGRAIRKLKKRLES